MSHVREPEERGREGKEMMPRPQKHSLLPPDRLQSQSVLSLGHPKRLVKEENRTLHLVGTSIRLPLLPRAWQDGAGQHPRQRWSKIWSKLRSLDQHSRVTPMG